MGIKLLRITYRDYYSGHKSSYRNFTFIIPFVSLLLFCTTYTLNMDVQQLSILIAGFAILIGIIGSQPLQLIDLKSRAAILSDQYNPESISVFKTLTEKTCHSATYSMVLLTWGLLYSIAYYITSNKITLIILVYNYIYCALVLYDHFRRVHALYRYAILHINPPNKQRDF